MPVTAADLLYDRVLPFYEALGVKVSAILTDNVRICVIYERHSYELLLAMEDIGHRTTKIRSPRTNAFVERMNRTLLDECFGVRGRQAWCIGPDEIQRDLDRFLRYDLTKALAITESRDIIPAEGGATSRCQRLPKP